MDIAEFKASQIDDTPPPSASPALQALWWEAKGDWHRAHQLAQAERSSDGAWVHAYLHRVEGDLGNAGYWYRRAEKQMATAALADEWAEIATALLA